MADKIKGNNSGAGGGGGRGGGGEIMESTFASGGGGSEPAFHKLLPNIAEAVELLDGATLEDVQHKLEEMTSVKYSKSELILGLENGIQLGLFDYERQYQLNAKFIADELKASKGDIGKLDLLVKKKLQEEKQFGALTRRKKSGRTRTKSLRSRKSKRSTRDDEWPTMLEKSDRLKICDHCKKKISSLTIDSDSDTGPRDSDSGESVSKERLPNQSEENNSKRKKQSSPEPQKNQQTPKKKSKLLVERNNSLKNDPPYCDIFS